MDNLVEIVAATEKLLDEAQGNIRKIKKMEIPKELAGRVASLAERCRSLIEPFRYCKARCAKLLVEFLCDTKLDEQLKYQSGGCVWGIISPEKIMNNHGAEMTLDQFIEYIDKYGNNIPGFCKTIVDVVVTSCTKTRDHLREKVNLMTDLSEQLKRVIQFADRKE